MIDKNCPAFPCTEANYSDPKWTSDGMTLRDYFAAKAMQSELYMKIRNIHENSFTDEDIAKWAYKTADAMMKAREA